MGAEVSVQLLFAHACMLKAGWPLGLNTAKREPGSLQHLAFSTSSGCWETGVIPQQGAAYLHQTGVSTAINSPIRLARTANAPAEFKKSTWIQNRASYCYNSGAKPCLYKPMLPSWESSDPAVENTRQSSPTAIHTTTYIIPQQNLWHKSNHH